jgi:prevent-host-death family protein
VDRVSVKDARRQFRALLNRVTAGEEVVIQRRGKDVARIVPPTRPSRRLPDLSGFRASLRVRGEPLSAVVARARKGERY